MLIEGTERVFIFEIKKRRKAKEEIFNSIEVYQIKL